MKFSFVIVALFAGYAAAAAVPACVKTCSQAAAKSSKCGSYTSKACVCKSSAFNSAATKCITSKCSAKDQAAALQLKHQLCG
ncbi:hypothetical protein FRC10_008307 [Ceratobasidium sp. 414]|nr:hypothetical protein FRC10_008307 [Ceratobasidium sp. 414]